MEPVSPTLLLALLFLLSVSTADGYYTSNNSSIPGCDIGDCGDGVKIPYPFWVSNPNSTSTSFCGYKEFMITCNHNRPSFRTLTDNYTARAIDTDKNILSLIDSDVIGSDCPKARQNVSLGTTSSLTLSPSNLYLVFFFNCDLKRLKGVEIPPGNVLPCLWNVSGTSYVFDRDHLPENSGLWSACDDKTVESPVLKGSQLNEGNLSASFGKAMNHGFDVIWKMSEMENCRSCEESGGNCGYNNATREGLVFRCFCKDGKYYAGDCNGSGEGQVDQAFKIVRQTKQDPQCGMDIT